MTIDRAALTMTALVLACVGTACGAQGSSSRGDEPSHPGGASAPVSTPTPVLLAGNANAPEAWAVTASGLKFSDDGGASWRDVASPFSPNDYLDLARADADHAWAVGAVAGEVRLARSSDGGATWNSEALSLDATGADVSIQLLSPAIGYVAIQRQLTYRSAEGWLYASADGGNHFTKSSLPPITGVATFESAAVGTYTGIGGLTFRSEDAGQTWQQQKLVAPLREGEVQFGPPFTIDGTTLLPATKRLGDGRTSFYLAGETNDGHLATTGQAISLEDDTGGAALPTASDGKVIWVATSDGSTLYASGNRGATWSIVRTSGLSGGVVVLARPADGRGFAVVQQGSCAKSKSDCAESAGIYVSADDGRTWTPAEL